MAKLAKHIVFFVKRSDLVPAVRKSMGLVLLSCTVQESMLRFEPSVKGAGVTMSGFGCACPGRGSGVGFVGFCCDSQPFADGFWLAAQMHGKGI